MKPDFTHEIDGFDPHAAWTGFVDPTIAPAAARHRACACADQAAIASTGRRRRAPPRGADAASARVSGSTTGVESEFLRLGQRRSACATERSSPVSPSSPKQASGRPPDLAATTAATRAGHRQRDREVGARLVDAHAADDVDEHVRRAERRCRRGVRARPARARGGCGRGPRPPAAAARAPIGETSACTSTSSGREPSIAHSTTLPGARVASPTKRAEASSTSTSPWSRISNTPASLVEPNRFFSARTCGTCARARPRTASTQSTRCSSTRGPASAPSLVTWPTSSTAMRRALATRMIAPATSRTCATDPAALDRSLRGASAPSRSRTPRGAPARASPARCEVGLAITGIRSAAGAQPLGAQADLRRRLLGRDVQRAAARGSRLPSAIVVSVDLPIPARRRSGPASRARCRRRARCRARRCRCAGAPARRRATSRARPASAAAAPRDAAARPRRPACATCSSTSVFHSPQPGQRPAQRGASCPQAEQT